MIRTHAAIATKWEARWKVRRIGFCEAMTVGSALASRILLSTLEDMASGGPAASRSAPAHHQAPCLRPNHQISPSVAVLWSLLNTFCVPVRKTGSFDQSYLNSVFAWSPSAMLYPYVTVNSFNAWVTLLNRPPVKKAPRSSRYSARAARYVFGES